MSKRRLMDDARQKAEAEAKRLIDDARIKAGLFCLFRFVSFRFSIRFLHAFLFFCAEIDAKTLIDEAQQKANKRILNNNNT